jgi:hypothetical protein
MFSWANQQLSKLADTVLAPVPENTPYLRFLSACSSGDELTAKACVDEMMTLSSSGGVTSVIGSPSKGMQAIHYAAFNGMIEVTRTLLLAANVPIDTFDYQGNTPLHHAVLNRDNPLSFIRFLVEEHNASVVVKNAQGQTPYDVATNVNVRSYLLPRQLQQETMTAIQSGGQGLIPGMDMGGYAVAVPAAASAPPPPIITNTNTRISVQGAPPPPPLSTASPMILEANQQPLEHARYNTASSAPNSANLRYRPDGFHSSSSDVNLQTKYGHVAVPTVVPPPPPPPPGASSSTAGVVGLPPPPFSYAANTAIASGNNSRSTYPTTTSRYLAYDAVTGQSMAVIPNRTQVPLPPQPPNIAHVFAPPPTLHQDPTSLITNPTTGSPRTFVSTMSQQQQQPLSSQAYPFQRENPEEEEEEDAFLS